MNAPAEPRTPSIATPTALNLCAFVGVGKSWGGDEVPFNDLDEMGSRLAGDDEKKDVGRAMSTTPRREIKDAYCADRGKGSRRKM